MVFMRFVVCLVVAAPYFLGCCVGMFHWFRPVSCWILRFGFMCVVVDFSFPRGVRFRILFDGVVFLFHSCLSCFACLVFGPVLVLWFPYAFCCFECLLLRRWVCVVCFVRLHVSSVFLRFRYFLRCCAFLVFFVLCVSYPFFLVWYYCWCLWVGFVLLLIYISRYRLCFQLAQWGCAGGPGVVPIPYISIL